MTGPLFGASLPPVPPASLRREWLPRAQQCHDKLRDLVPWERHASEAHGTPMPRREVWYSSQARPYVYNGQTYHPQPLQGDDEAAHILRWLLARVARAMVEAYGFEAAPNAVFLNLYGSGRDHIGWHADDVAVLGPPSRVVIGSLSLGARRRFLMRHNVSGHQVEWSLGDGDLLIMGPGSQSDWKHKIAKTSTSVQSRINLTFRRVF